jgi:hypothetical protein
MKSAILPSEPIGGAAVNATDGVTLVDFHAYLPAHRYIFVPTRELWPASSVNSRVEPTTEGGKPVPASAWLDKNRSVEQMTWAPGMPEIIESRLVSDGGWIEREGVRTFNLYRPPVVRLGDPRKARPWLDHWREIYPEEVEHIIKFLAFKVQNPGEKINHALVLGGNQGIGKDTALEPVKHAVGPFNVAEVSPSQVMGRFNGFVKSVILRVSEARDLGDSDRFKFYDHMKTLAAAPPDVLLCDEKNLREHKVFNCCGVIITTNHKADGIYLPADDRRHFVAWSDKTKEDFGPEYWNRLWRWYEGGGFGHVAAYLATLDLAGFDPKAPPPKTAAFWEIVDASRPPEEGELSDIIERMGSPGAFTLRDLQKEAASMGSDASEWLADRKNRRVIPHRLETCGYVPVRNPDATDGLWKVFGKRQVIYATVNLGLRDRLEASRRIAA